MALAALGAAEAASFGLPLQVLQALLAEVVAAGEHVRAAVYVQAQRAGKLLLQALGVTRLAESHVDVHTVQSNTEIYKVFFFFSSSCQKLRLYTSRYEE